MTEPPIVSASPLHSLEAPAPLMDSGNNSTALQSSIDLPVPPSTTMPEISLTFLLISGRRRTMSFAASTTIGRVKELVWNSWPADWSDQRPPAPNYLRILYLGKMLQDEDVLESIYNPLCPSGPGLSPPSLSSTTSPPGPQPHSTIVHLSIRPVPPQSDTHDLKKKRRAGSTSSGHAGGSEESAGCCATCVIC